MLKIKIFSGIEDLDERARLDWICLNIGKEFLIENKDNNIDNIEKVSDIVNKYSNIDIV
ncbi:hypothetical protein OFR22_05485 [Brachyspira hyodysenteriae]|nr:hypothetical protein [Brachyspira hyodysenteriae]MCZ9994825.1 hypothetical protein [Brachyspira hyodysenteriae]